MKTRIKKMLLLSACCVLLCAAPGLAEDTGTLLEPVTVTAQKREEDVQKVPMSASVISETAIEDASIQSTHDIQNHVPNLFTSHAGSRGYFSRIAIRGVSNTGIGDPGVALYIDDIPYSDLYIFNTPLFDIERIEVLKGPQGTLYGKNTEGGAINIITKKPGNQLGGTAGMEVGTFNRRQLHTSVNIPLIKDELNLRIAALAGGRDGYIHNVTTNNEVDEENTKILRGSLAYTPSDKLTIDANASVTKLDDGGFPMTPKDKGKYKAATGTSVDDFEVGNNFEGKSETTDILSSLKIRYEADNFDMLSVSGLRSDDNDLTLDADFTPTPVYYGENGHDGIAFTQEFRFMSKPSQTDFEWLVGAFYGYENKDVYSSYVLESNGFFDKMSARQIAQDGAIFGQSTLRFLNEALGLTGGLRLDLAHREIDRDDHYTFGGALQASGYKEDTLFVNVLPKVAVDYRFTNNVMAYGNFAQGFKAGGYSYAVDDPKLAKFDPEKSNAFEAGLKTEFPDLGLRANMAVFYNYIEDYQDRVPVSPMVVLQANSGSMTSRGFELESEYRFLDDWSLMANFGYTNAEYGDYHDALNGTNYKGNKVALFPEYEAGLVLQYRTAPGFMGRIELHRRGKTYLERTNTIEQAPYNFANLKLGYETTDWDVYLTAENLTNEEYYVDGMETPNLGFVGTTGPPRNFRLSGMIRF